MGGRGTFASGNPVLYTYETVGKYEGVKILTGMPGTGLHDLPAEAHSSEMYLKLHKDQTMNMLRVYGKDDHLLKMEFAYHPEPKLTGNHDPVLHVHFYDEKFHRTGPMYVSKELFEQYKKYMKGRKWYD